MIGTSVFYENRKPAHNAKLSLVSLMDIFTILVFFLLLNSGESERIENAKFVQLPNSTSGLAPHTELQIVITDAELLMGDEPVAKIDQVMESSDRIIEELAHVLNLNAEKLGELSAYQKQAGLAVTVSADKSVPYALLEKVMTTCQQTGYRNISLAVNRIGGNVALQAAPEVTEPARLTTNVGGGS